jgi:nitrogen regulatory protein PII
MIAVKRLEIVTAAVQVDRVCEQLDQLGAPGYTVIRQVEGMGHRGRCRGDELTGVFQNSLVMVCCEESLALRIVEAVRPTLRDFGGICVVTDALIASPSAS